MNINHFRIILLLIFLVPVSVFAANKKDSLNQIDPLMKEDDIKLAGEWKIYMDKCGKKQHLEFLENLAKLSWPDYKIYMAAAAKYTSGGWSAGPCNNKDTKAVWDYYDWIISELTYLTGSDNNTYSENDTGIDSELNDIDQVEDKLIKLKQLYDDGLITLQEYEDKKSEILDNF